MVIIESFWAEIQGAFQGLFTAAGAGDFEGIVSALGGVIWSPILAILCLGGGLYFSLQMKFMQARKIKKMFTLLFSGASSDKGVSSFQSFALALSGRLGTGNIVGVATAIAYGGPGALFWMWMIGFIGAGTAFVESTLGQLYKQELRGEYRGGPAYYFAAFGYKKLSILFIIATILATTIFLPGIQGSAITLSIEQNWGIPQIYVMVFVCTLLAIVLIGGTKSITKFSEITLPYISVIYVLVAAVILIVNIQHLPEVFMWVIKGAFGLDPILGGSVGMAILWGVKRGVFSNEAGQGTGAHIAAAAEVNHPARQGLVQASSIYFDTLGINTATGFVIMMTNQFSVFVPDGAKNADGTFQTLPGYGFMGGSSDDIVRYVPEGFNTLLTGFGGKFVSIALFFFAFTCFLAYFYYGSTNLEFIMKDKSERFKKVATTIMKVVLIGSAFVFGIRSNALAWSAADIGLGIMAYVNIIGILIIGKPAIIAFKDYERREKAGTDGEKFFIEDLPEDEQKCMKGITFWTKDNEFWNDGKEHITAIKAREKAAKK